MRKKQTTKNLNEEEKRNLVGLFKILIDVDRRINPQNYKKKPNAIN